MSAVGAFIDSWRVEILHGLLMLGPQELVVENLVSTK